MLILVNFAFFVQTNKKRITDYPNLWAYVRELFQMPGVAVTVDQEHIMKHYYVGSSYFLVSYCNFQVSKECYILFHLFIFTLLILRLSRQKQSSGGFANVCQQCSEDRLSLILSLSHLHVTTIYIANINVRGWQAGLLHSAWWDGTSRDGDNPQFFTIIEIPRTQIASPFSG